MSEDTQMSDEAIDDLLAKLKPLLPDDPLLLECYDCIEQLRARRDELQDSIDEIAGHAPIRRGKSTTK